MTKYNRESTGALYNPRSNVPESAYLKARRLRESNVAKGSMPLYRGKTSQENLMLPDKPKNMDNYIAHQSIPGLYIEPKLPRGHKKRVKFGGNGKVDQAIQVHTDDGVMLSKNIIIEGTNPAKKLRNLRKVLREVETLERRIKKGELPKPQPEQLVKLGRKVGLKLQIAQLERELH